MKNVLLFGTYKRIINAYRIRIPMKWVKQSENSYYCFNNKYFINKKDLFNHFNNMSKELILPNIKEYKLYKDNRIRIVGIKSKFAILKGCDTYFIIEFK